MRKPEFLKLLDNLMDLPAGSLRGEDSLEELEGWDSMAAMDFLALVDESFGCTLSPQRLAECRIVDDLVSAVGDRISE